MRSGKSVVIPRQSGSHMSLAGFAVLLPEALGPTFSQVRLKLAMPGQAGVWSGALPASQLGALAIPVSALL